MCCLGWPLRGHARSHGIVTGFKTCTVFVGVGEPEKGSAQPVENYQGIEQWPQKTPNSPVRWPRRWWMMLSWG
ncbi:hypothetical protein C6A77_14105 [Pseudomonas sp. AFG_SD02_1510_Pfu_092]|nr:hypothetical protein C6A77_14105 [Pseudomonas sp. AFG_SD02_1510_Pfu_092]